MRPRLGQRCCVLLSHIKSTSNDFLVARTKGLQPGRALVVHMGQGRDPLYLAEQGWDVTGFDIPQEGVAHARAETDRRRIRIKAIRQTHQQFDFGRSTWDLVVISHAWVLLAGAALINRIIDSIRPGGLLVFEHHMETSGRQRDKGDWLPRPKQHLSTFGRLQVLKYEGAVALPTGEEGSQRPLGGVSGKAAVCVAGWPHWATPRANLTFAVAGDFGPKMA